MDYSDFLIYFEKSKEELKSLLKKVQKEISDIEEVIELDPEDQEFRKILQVEEERYRAIKLAIIAVDDHACLSTVDMSDYGTLDVNKMYGYENYFKFQL